MCLTKKNAVDADDVWNSETLANLYLNKVYLDLLPSFGRTLPQKFPTVGWHRNRKHDVRQLSDEAACGNFSSTVAMTSGTNHSF